ncbi:AAA family ATPase [Novosphingobium lindaniclasticum]|uniref:Uncharacterized protein n=1 Tax=Novosphingobium lindaniclasticum LE124 TaxID=1096930 RepID=T0HN81_9SPHN|nr:AAA family ATPase [Novosphingobium lindaniclasticum]EQB17806.1 hypothetical protein L284_06400 [Novosphingobium lindaniclasticum LE124]
MNPSPANGEAMPKISDTGTSRAPSTATIAITPNETDMATSMQIVGFEPDTDIPGAFVIPAGVLVLEWPPDTDGGLPLHLPGPPVLITDTEGSRYYVYRIAPGFQPINTAQLPHGRILRAGDRLPIRPDVSIKRKVQSPADIPELLEGCHLIEPVPPEVVPSPLAPYSLRGKAQDFMDNVVMPQPLLGNICYSGQATVWYAPPNAGKTLLVMSLLNEAVQDKRVQPGNVYYINADDSSAGFATKMALMDELKVHTLAPGHQGFETGELIKQLKRMAETATAKGVFIVVDTLKKFVDLMHKAQASEFGDACRRFVMAGGSILALAHTNKNASVKGRLVYAGTADLIQDFDAVYVMTPAEDAPDSTDRLVGIRAEKRRGCGAEECGFRYTRENDISYEQRMLSVQMLDASWESAFERDEAEQTEAKVIEAIKDVIGQGVNQKMKLSKTVAKRLNVSARQVVRILEKGTGTDPGQHHWTLEIVARGANAFTVLEPEPLEVSDEHSSISRFQAPAGATGDVPGCESEILAA